MSVEKATRQAAEWLADRQATLSDTSPDFIDIIGALLDLSLIPDGEWIEENLETPRALKEKTAGRLLVAYALGRVKSWEELKRLPPQDNDVRLAQEYKEKQARVAERRETQRQAEEQLVQHWETQRQTLLQSLWNLQSVPADEDVFREPDRRYQLQMLPTDAFERPRYCIKVPDATFHANVDQLMTGTPPSVILVRGTRNPDAIYFTRICGSTLAAAANVVQGPPELAKLLGGTPQEVRVSTLLPAEYAAEPTALHVRVPHTLANVDDDTLTKALGAQLDFAPIFHVGQTLTLPESGAQLMVVRVIANEESVALGSRQMEHKAHLALMLERDQSDEPIACRVCASVRNLHHCGDCMQVIYCSAECQAHDWSTGNHCYTCIDTRARRGRKFHKVMREYKRGKLHSGSKRGPIVRNRKQALAIAYAEEREK